MPSDLPGLSYEEAGEEIREGDVWVSTKPNPLIHPRTREKARVLTLDGKKIHARPLHRSKTLKSREPQSFSADRFKGWILDARARLIERNGQPVQRGEGEQIESL